MQESGDRKTRVKH